MGIIYLHIGTPKTGTTAIQNFLYANRGLLVERGFVYPDFGHRYPNIGVWRNGYFLSRVGRDVFTDEKEDSFRQLAKLAKEHERIILSDESIWKKQKKEGFWETIGGRMREMGCELHIIVYLRRQDALMESTWNQRVKSYSDFSMTFAEFLQTEHHYMPLHYDRMLQLIKEHSGAKMITVRAFERGQLLGGSVIDDFCGVIGFPVDDECEMPEADMNISLDANVLDIKRLINQNAAYASAGNFYQSVISESFATDVGKHTHPRESLIDDKTREAFLERFVECNEYVARQFLGREDGRLFYQDVGTGNRWNPVWEEMYPALVRVMSGADSMLYRRIAALEKRVEELAGGADGSQREETGQKEPMDQEERSGKFRQVKGKIQKMRGRLLRK